MSLCDGRVFVSGQLLKEGVAIGTCSEKISFVCASASLAHSGRIKGLMLVKLKCHGELK